MSFTEGKDLEQVRLWDHLPSSWACRHGRGGEGEKKDKPQEQPEEKDTEGWHHSNVYWFLSLNVFVYHFLLLSLGAGYQGGAVQEFETMILILSPET